MITSHIKGIFKQRKSNQHKGSNSTIPNKFISGIHITPTLLTHHTWKHFRCWFIYPNSAATSRVTSSPENQTWLLLTSCPQNVIWSLNNWSAIPVEQTSRIMIFACLFWVRWSYFILWKVLFNASTNLIKCQQITNCRWEWQKCDSEHRYLNNGICININGNW